jgi:hypothetical protein
VLVAQEFIRPGVNGRCGVSSNIGRCKMQTRMARLGSTVGCGCVIAILAGLLFGAVLTGDARAQKAKGDPLKMTCPEHGAANMTLEFVREDGPGRKVEITGNNSTTLWTVKIDDKDVTPGTQTDKKPGQVKLHVDDKITWKITGSTHGIVFPTQKDAEAMFDFDPKQGKPLGKSTAVTGFTWGTDKFSAADPLAVATVKK